MFSLFSGIDKLFIAMLYMEIKQKRKGMLLSTVLVVSLRRDANMQLQ